MGAVLFACAVFIAACSGTVNSVVPNPKPIVPSPGHRIGHGAFFVPVLPPFSPDTPYTLNAVTTRKPHTFTGPQNDHWFYLVNGYELQTPIPGVPGSAPTPEPGTVPYVLAVNGPLPKGAPGPNGGVTVDTLGLGQVAQPNMLWKIVQVTPGSTNKNQRFYLRSAQSFLPLQPWVGQTPIPSGASVPAGTYPSLLTGFAAQAANLDLGALAGSNPAVYLNQNTFPFTSGQTSFQQWYYDVATQSVNAGNGGVLAQTCAPMQGTGCVGVVGGSAGPTSRWYAYPNYLLATVVTAPTSGPAFPQPSVTTVPGAGVTDVNGEEAAYYYISLKSLPPPTTSLPPIQTLPHCSIPGEPGYGPDDLSYGIRCVYINFNDTGNLSDCESNANANRPPRGPQPYNPTNPSLKATISSADWAVIGPQLYKECTYAYDVIDTITTYNSVLNTIFIGSEGELKTVSTEIAETQPVTVSPLMLLRGIVYAVLSVGGPGSGLFANLVQTTIDYNQAHKGPLTAPVTATASSLYGQLSYVFTSYLENDSQQLQAIVWSWQRLKIIGPLTTQDGPNGLGISNPGLLATQGINAYQTVFLQTFYPLAYTLSMNPVQKSNNPFKSPSYDTFAYSTYGSATGSYTVNVLCQGETKKFNNCPTQALMATPAPLPAQAHFALFNGLNGWSQIPRTSQGLECSNTMIDVFNGTPNLLTVQAVPAKSRGSVGSPGGWSTKPYSAQLFPYGYVPIYAAYGVPFGGQAVLELTVNVMSGSSTVGTFTVNDGFCGVNYVRNINASNVSTASGWSFYPQPYGNAYTYPGSNLWAAPGYGGNYPGFMWVVIQ